MRSAQITAPGSLVRRLGRLARGNTYTVGANPSEWQEWAGAGGSAPSGRGTGPPPETQLPPAAVSAPDPDAARVTSQVR